MTPIKSSFNYSEIEANEFKLSRAFYLYEKPSKEGVLIQHKIKSNGQMGLGIPINKNSLINVFNDAQGDDTNFIPSHLLINNSNIGIWWSKSIKRKMFFRISNRPPTILNVYYPAFIWGVNKNLRSLHIASIANRRPKLSTKTYHAPLMNVSGSGLVCQGTATIPKVLEMNEKNLIEIENCIFNSNFTHVNYDHTLKAKPKKVTTQQHFKYWQTKAKNNAQTKLTEFNQSGTVADFIKGVSK